MPRRHVTILEASRFGRVALSMDAPVDTRLFLVDARNSAAHHSEFEAAANPVFLGVVRRPDCEACQIWRHAPS